MIRKRFERSEYKKYDHFAKRAVMQYLQLQGYKVKDKEDYRSDLVVQDNKGEFSFHEVEVKKGWTGDWPRSWKSVHIPKRKSKLWWNTLPSKVHFWVCRVDGHYAWYLNGKIVSESELVEVKNYKIPNGEYFFDVDISKCGLIHL
tara:strand:+ start:1718 stop:2152 length:435 start_codon:yes stop_codon:yes gene_type:complete